MTDSSICIDDIYRAREKIAAALSPTPLAPSAYLGDISGRKVYLKWENRMRTGSFKERGACNFLYSLSETEARQGVLAASAGNHALAVSYHAQRLGISCKIIMPRFAPLIKVQQTRKHGAEVVLHGSTFNEALEKAQEQAQSEGRVFVPAFDDKRIIAGQGTCALEILEQCKDCDGVVVPVGGGGLISGIAVVLAALRPDLPVIGVQSEWVMQERQSKPQPDRLVPATIADGIAVKRIGALTAPIIDKNVQRLIPVSERAIAKAIITLLEGEKTVVEGAGASGIAALLENLIPPEIKKPLFIISGSNIDMSLLSRLLERDMSEQQRLLQLKISVPDRPGSLRRIVEIIAACGGNIVRILHDRSFSHIPGNVDVSLLLEVHDAGHQDEIIAAMHQAGMAVTRS